MSSTLSLYHRTKFWGEEIQGYQSKELYREFGILGKTLSLQAVIENHNNFNGCCYKVGSRVVEIDECPFLHQHPGFWNLYMLGQYQTKTNANHYFRFCLLPDFHPAPLCSQLVGSVDPAQMREYLAVHLSPFLMGNRAFGYPRNHVHIIVYMDTIWAEHSRRQKKQPLFDLNEHMAMIAECNSEDSSDSADSAGSESTNQGAPY